MKSKEGEITKLQTDLSTLRESKSKQTEKLQKEKERMTKSLEDVIFELKKELAVKEKIIQADAEKTKDLGKAEQKAEEKVKLPLSKLTTPAEI